MAIREAGTCIGGRKMDESRWLSEDDPAAMLEYLVPRDGTARGMVRQPVASDRKLRLFAVGCCRQVWPQMDDQNSRKAVEIAEQLADGALADDYERISYGANTMTGCLCEHARTAAREASRRCADLRGQSKASQANLLRCVFGNPWRPVTLCGLDRKPFHNQHAHVDMNGSFWLEAECPACGPIRTDCVVSIARELYESRQFGGAPVLADALEEAGCVVPDVLMHLRGPGPHCRGCWVVDLILGKS